MPRLRRSSAKPGRLVIEIDLVPLGRSTLFENKDGQVLFPHRVVVDGQPVQASRSQHDWFLVKTEDWYLHLSWGARRRQAKEKE